LAIVSNYFWLLLLLIPIRAFCLLWTNVLGPWFFQEAPEDTEQDEKKRKKLERKKMRYQQ
ncbi:SND2/TMEM208 family protein, partial [Escherichia coli]|uniref:SND2/TMEM208 family protein n=1 Tax=Escherichia coli TaxID=562 RepID=UPI00200EC6EB